MACGRVLAWRLASLSRATSSYHIHPHDFIATTSASPAAADAPAHRTALSSSPARRTCVCAVCSRCARTNRAALAAFLPPLLLADVQGVGEESDGLQAQADRVPKEVRREFREGLGRGRRPGAPGGAEGGDQARAPQQGAPGGPAAQQPHHARPPHKGIWARRSERKWNARGSPPPPAPPAPTRPAACWLAGWRGEASPRARARAPTRERSAFSRAPVDRLDPSHARAAHRRRGRRRRRASGAPTRSSPTWA